MRRLDSQLIAELPKRLLIIVIIHDHFFVCVCTILQIRLVNEIVRFGRLVK